MTCQRSGYCCKVAPCPFGRWSTERGQCEHLQQAGEIAGLPLYECGIYDEIIGQPGAEWSPAFGAGCCSGMNEYRRKIIEAKNAKATSPRHPRR